MWFIALFIVTLILSALLYFKRKAYIRQIADKTEYEIIKLSPPREIDFNETASQQLFSILSELDSTRSFYHRLLGIRSTFSLEVSVTELEGICFCVRVPQNIALRFEKAIRTHMPSMKTSKTDDYLIADDPDLAIMEFVQSNHFAYPLKTIGHKEGVDPIHYLFGYMRDVKSKDALVMQLVVAPGKSREASHLRNDLYLDSRTIRHLNGTKSIFGFMLSVISSVSSAVLDSINGAGGSQSVPSNEKPLSDHEHLVARSVMEKLNDKLFICSVRMGVRTADQTTKAKVLDDIRTAMSAYDSLEQQSLVAKGKIQTYISSKQINQDFFTRRINRRPLLLSAAEVSALFHFPDNRSAQIKNMDTSITKTLSVPLDQKRNKLAILLGINTYHGETTKIGLTDYERERHMFVLGGTGSGKSTLGEGCCIQDISSGNGTAFIDPHGDSAVKLLDFVPQNRVQDVIYFNPSDSRYPIGLNLLELKVAPNATSEEIEEERERVTESIIAIFRKTFSEDGDSGGHRIEYVLRCALLTAMTVENATIFTVYRLLNDPTYRKQIIRTLTDKDLVSFWKKELGSAGKMQEIKMYAGITAKIGRFLFSTSAKRIFGQPKSTINFDEVLDGKILICNLSKGKLGEDISSVYGTLILEQIKLAGFRRVSKTSSDRKPFYVYVDEFQNFATKPFIDMLAESRKYKLFITMLEQSTAQQNDNNITNTILANVGTIICFRSASPVDEKYMLPIMGSSIDEGDIINLESYNFYVRILAHKPQPTFSGITVLPSRKRKLASAEEVIASSRKNYGSQMLENKKPGKHIKQKAEKQEILVLPGG